MRTLADVIQQARYFIQDSTAPLRQSDEELESYLVDAFGELYKIRPDVFPTGDNPCTGGLPSWDDLSDPFPLADQWFRGVAYYVAASAELKDDEHVDNGRSGFLFTMAFRSMGIQERA